MKKIIISCFIIVLSLTTFSRITDAAVIDIKYESGYKANRTNIKTKRGDIGLTTLTNLAEKSTSISVAPEGTSTSTDTVVLVLPDVYNLKSINYVSTVISGTINFYDEDWVRKGATVSGGTTFINNRAIDIKSVKYITFYHDYGQTAFLQTLSFKGELTRPLDYQEITNFDSSVNDNVVTLNWQYPETKDIAAVRIYKDGTFLKQVTKTLNTTTDTVDYGQSYTYTIKALYLDDTESTGLSKKIDIPIPQMEVEKIEAKATYQKVSLSWQLPKYNAFQHVNIYRDTKTEMLRAAVSAPTKIFETNGTYFNDLTVNPETTYEYKLTTTSTNGIESDGVLKEVKTPEEPPPTLEDGNLEETDGGDFKFTWQEPTTGTVKIVVGGKDYTIVEAAKKEVIIPKKDMRYTLMGDPDVQAIPVSESGKEGNPSRPPSGLSDMELPFGVTDLLKTGSGLLWWTAPFILLGLAFLLVPKLRNLIVNAVRGKRGEKELIETERRTKSESKEKIESLQTEKEPSESKNRVEKQGKKLRSVRVRERQIKEPKDRRERALKEPKISRVSREIRQPRQVSNRTREAREGRQSERVQRMPREPRQGR